MNKAVFWGILSICITTLIIYALERIDLVEQRYYYNSCMETAKDSYIKQWNFKCKLEKKSDDCTLNGLTAKLVDDEYKADKQACLDIFKEKAFWGGN